MNFSLAHIFVIAVGFRHWIQLILTARRKKGGRGEEYVTTAVFAICQGTAFIFAFLSLWGATTPRFRHMAGFLLMEISVILRVLALWELKDNYSYHLRVAPDQTLVTTGVYSITRHPLHWAFLGETAGMAFISGAPIPMFLAFLVLPGAILYRNQREDGALLEKFGESFLEYKRKTPL